MPHLSKIARLPPPVSKAFHQWLDDPGSTQKEVVRRTNALLAERGLEVRLTLHNVIRYCRRRREMGEARGLPRRPHPSKIDRMPSEVRQAVRQWLDDPGISQGEVVRRTNALLAERGLKERINRQSLGTYGRRIRQVGQWLQESRAVAEAWAGWLGEQPGVKLSRLVTEIVRTLAFDLSLRVQEGTPTLPAEAVPNTVKMVSQLAATLQRLEQTSSEAARRERRIRESEREQAAQAAERAGRRQRGLSRDTIDQIKREILGLRDEDESEE